MILRRNFLEQGMAALAGPAIRNGTSAPGNLIDSHVHVWTNDFSKYPLASGFTPEQMKPPVFLPQEILRHATPYGVDRIVLIQMSYYRFDNSYMLDVIRRQPKVFRGIAIVDWKSNEPGAKMRELAKQGVRGFRIYPGGAPPASWLDGEGFEKMFRCGAK